MIAEETDIAKRTLYNHFPARKFGIPVVVNIPGVKKIIKDRQLITVDDDEGKVYLQVYF